MSWNEMWANVALCQKSSPDELFVRGAEQHKAKAVCGACPVRAECLARRWTTRSSGACGEASPSVSAVHCCASGRT
jgi:hypothetical protein